MGCIETVALIRVTEYDRWVLELVEFKVGSERWDTDFCF